MFAMKLLYSVVFGVLYFSLSLLIFSCIFSFSHHHRHHFVDAVRVFLIDPTQFDPTTKKVAPTWQERDYTSTDSDGGILIFDGALGEGTTLEIRNIVAKNIDINATLSRGCTVIVENCTLFNPTGTESSLQRDSALSIGTTTFVASDGKVGCSKTSRSTSSSSSPEYHKITFIIRNNSILNVGHGYPMGPNRELVSKSSFLSSIVLYNPIVCHKNDNNADDVVTADVVIENNLIRPISANVLGATLFMVSIFPFHRVSSDLVRECATTANNNSSPCIYFEPNIPLSALQIINNNFTASTPSFATRMRFVCVSFGNFQYISEPQWPQLNFQFLNDRTSAGSSITLDRNSFLIVTESPLAQVVFWLCDAGKNSSSSSLASSASRPPFAINFINQKSIRITVTNESSSMTLLHLPTLSQLPQFRSSVNFISNTDIVFPNNTWLRSIAISCSRQDTNVVIANSKIQIDYTTSDAYQDLFVALPTSSRIFGNVTVQNVSMTVVKSSVDYLYFYFVRGSYMKLANVHVSDCSFAFHDTTLVVVTAVVIGTSSVDNLIHISRVTLMTSPEALSSHVDEQRDSNLLTIFSSSVPRIEVFDSKMEMSNNCRLVTIGEVFVTNLTVMRSSVVAEGSGAVVIARGSSNVSTGTRQLLILNNSVIARQASLPPVALNFIFDATASSSEYRIENNVAHCYKATGTVSFLFGAGVASPESPTQNRILIVKNNRFVLEERAGGGLKVAIFVSQPTFTSITPKEQWFNMYKIILDGNYAHITGGITAFAHQVVIVSSTFNPAIDTVSKIESPAEFVFTNNNFHVNGSGLAAVFQLCNLKNLQNLQLNNNSFFTTAPTFNRFAIFSHSSIQSLRLSTTACSYFNNKIVDRRSTQQNLADPLTGFAVSLSGTGVPTSVGGIDPGICATTRTKTYHHQQDEKTATVVVNTTNSTTDNPKSTSPTTFFPPSISTTASSAPLALSSFAASVSVAALAIRTRTILSGVDEIMQNDCGSPFDPEELFETAPLLSASPTQLYISGGGFKNGGYATGLIIGDFVLILAICGCWFGFFAVIEKFILPSIIQQKKKNYYSKKTMTKSSSIFSWVFVAKSRVMIPLVNFQLLFLDPMFNSTIAIIVIKEVGVGWKVLGVLISIGVILVGFFFGVVIYKLLISRNPIEKFRKFRPDEQKRSQNPILKLWQFLMSAEGEWLAKKIGRPLTHNNNNNNKKKNNNQKISSSSSSNTRSKNQQQQMKNIVVTKTDVILWRMAEPVIDGFTDRFPRFTIVDIVVMLSLALALVIGHATANCTVMGALLLLPVSLHLLLVLMYRPDQELILKFLIPITDFLQVVIVSCALSQKVGDDVVKAIGAVLVALQMLLTALWIISIFLTILDVAKEFGVCRGNKIRRETEEKRNEGSINPNLRDMKLELKSSRHSNDQQLHHDTRKTPATTSQGNKQHGNLHSSRSTRDNSIHDHHQNSRRSTNQDGRNTPSAAHSSSGSRRREEQEKRRR